MVTSTSHTAESPEASVLTVVPAYAAAAITAETYATATEAAAAVAGDRRVHVMGGASIVQQALRTGLVDHLRLHIAPLLLGSGTALFDGIGLELERLDTVDTPEATHVTYRVGRPLP
jgi:dihydrofolate reductase